MKCEVIRIGVVSEKVISLNSTDIDPIPYYVEMFKKEFNDDYLVMNDRTKLIFQDFITGSEYEFKSPVEGKVFKLEDGAWRTSKVQKVINPILFITQNSVYALHNDKLLRDYKLEILDI